MKSCLILTFYLVALLCISCRSPVPHERTKEIDSLLTLLLTVQDTLSSPMVQLLDEMSRQISSDLKHLTDSFPQVDQDLPENDNITAYRILYQDLEDCLEACQTYQGDIFIIESHLNDLRLELNNKDADIGVVYENIDREKDLLFELKGQVDSNISRIQLHQNEYIILKPLIDSLKQTGYTD